MQDKRDTILVDRTPLNDILEFVRVSAELGFAEAVLDDMDLSDAAFERSVTHLDDAYNRKDTNGRL
jgi:hypothetical protein